MKLYKDAYGKKNDSYKKNGYNKQGNYKGNYNKNKKPYNKQGQEKAAPAKKTLWQKIKGFFGR